MGSGSVRRCRVLFVLSNGGCDTFDLRLLAWDNKGRGELSSSIAEADRRRRFFTGDLSEFGLSKSSIQSSPSESHEDVMAKAGGGTLLIEVETPSESDAPNLHAAL